jgi:YesN/AraC family two-component response regulator
MALCLSGLIFLIGYYSIKAQELFIIQNGNNKEKYIKSGLSMQDLAVFKIQIETYMNNHKPYLNPEFKLSDLARGLNLSANSVSQTINQGFNLNFYDFVNKYRVEEIKRMLSDNSYSNKTYLGLAMDAGFSNKSSFNRIFKKTTGKTPSEFVHKNNGNH